jgi:hypothetical protein
MRARLLISLAILAALVVSADPALAGGGRDSDAFVPPDGDPTVISRDEQTSTDPGSGPSTSDCTWEVAIDDDMTSAIYDVDTGERIYSETGRWLRRVCDGGPVQVNGESVVPEGGAVDPRTLAVEATASTSIPGPPISTSPDAGRRLYVQVPTWLWLDPGWWRPYDATAVAGRVSSTVTVVPLSTSWTMGDGSTVTCAGPGIPWVSGSTQASACSHTYRTSSATRSAGTFPLRATVTFEVSWTSNTGAGGSLPNIARSASVDVVVGEIQAINTT